MAKLDPDLLKQIEEAKRLLTGDRDQILKDQILKDEISKKPNHANSHLGSPLTKNNKVSFKNPKVKWSKTNLYRISMVIAPSWGVLFPPYNVAKLTSLLRKEGYSVKAYDVNIECYHLLTELTGEDYWRGERFFYWVFKDNFEKYIFDKIKPVLDKTVNDILKSNVKVVGFSVYNTNVHATIYMANKIREHNKDICIIVGGPETITGLHAILKKDKECINYFFIGESEENLLNLLSNLPKKLPSNEIVGSTKSRLSLEKYPYPDYSDYNLENYLVYGISMETSRGCVAQCSFCAETYFWDFRSLKAERVVDEIEYQVNKHNVLRVWFVDSLINGNIKNFERIVDLIIERKLHINWNSYARCDGRMDKEFFKKIRQSGGVGLSFGVESGSQKILDDMRKKIKIWEIENNFKDSYESGIHTHANWMIGFATEEPIDHFHSMQLLFNIRKYMKAISPGATAGIAAQSHSVTNYEEYNIIGNGTSPSYNSFLKSWSTKDFKNTIVHRFLRLKMFHIWLQIIDQYSGSIISNSHGYNIKDHYEFSFIENLEIETQEQDFKVNFFQFDNNLEGSIANEYVAFCYMLTKYFKGVKFQFRCDPDKDILLFGDLLARRYTTNVLFEIDEDDNFQLTIDHELEEFFKEKIVRKGHISDWKTDKEVVRETIHEQYRKKL